MRMNSGAMGVVPRRPTFSRSPVSMPIFPHGLRWNLYTSYGRILAEIMQSFSYSEVDSEAGEIRLVHLLPGEFNDPIRLAIVKSLLIAPKQETPSRSSRKELQASLPADWEVHETWGRRYIFVHKLTRESSWKHPNPEYLEERYHNRGSTNHLFQPSYEALSYTWGDTLNPVTIFLHDEGTIVSSGLEIQTFQATQNLASALRNLRSKDTIRTMWIDALCINQNNDREKSKQITRMRDVYKLARRVIVWLGEEGQNSGLALTTLQHLGSGFELSRERYGIPTPDNATDYQEFQNLVHSPVLEDNVWLALFHLYGRPWFGRIWVMQEVGLANPEATVQCGQDQLSWSVLQRALSRFHMGLIWPSASEEHRTAFGDRLQSIDYLAQLEPKHTVISQLLSASKLKAASDPKDRVYGILGLIPPWMDLNLVPDYTLSAGLVYKDVILRVAHATSTVDLLSYCQIDQRVPNLQSWVPNWSSRGQPVRILFFAIGLSTASQTRYIAPDILEVIGKTCGVVTAVSKPLPRDAEAFGQIIRTWESVSSKSLGGASTTRSIAAYMATLTRGVCCERFPRFSTWPSLEICINLYNARQEDKLLEHLTPFKPFGKTLLATEGGDIGLGNAAAQSGDIVFCLPGCDVPLLLRRVSADTFEVVGDCYFSHLDNEQGILGALPPNIHTRTVIDAYGFPSKHFYDVSTGDDMLHDPRLPELDTILSEYEALPVIAGKPHSFKNRSTGQVIERDLRLTCEDLISRGVELETLRLV